MRNWNKVLVALVITETVAIAAMIPLKLRVVSNRYQPVSYRDPLDEAIWYRASPQRFEQLVEQFPTWVNFKDSTDPISGEDLSKLTACALGRLTNYVEILVKHGADTNEALSWCEKHAANDAADLIRAAKGQRALE